VATAAATLEADAPIKVPVDNSVSRVIAEPSCPLNAKGPTDKMSASTCEVTTTMVVRPSVALGFARM
jgi:hypothetical protein